MGRNDDFGKLKSTWNLTLQCSFFDGVLKMDQVHEQSQVLCDQVNKIQLKLNTLVKVM